ncbi:MAG TPA: hypothetical protein DF613_03505 [Lachnospiraceae bacterium]|nr:hypothetical protein [Lachnospiraceae bacterium]
MKRIMASLLTGTIMATALAGCGASGTPSSAADASSGGADKSAVASAASEVSGSTDTEASSVSEPVETETSNAAESGSVAETSALTTDDLETVLGEADMSVLDGKKIGITIQSLENAYWAGVMSALEDVFKAHNTEYTIVDCKDNSATQIGQIENFISAGCDLMMVHASDADAIEDVCKSARDEGIKIMCWDDKMENADVDWIIDNTELGVEIGVMAGEFINEHFSADNKAQVAIIDYPQTPVLLERENGIIEG